MAEEAEPPHGDNAAPFSVSELSSALKRTVEERFGYVRLRGEISKVTRHASGHVYLTLKDENASIDGVVWRGVVSRLDCQPEQGLEVIVTGKITTYPARSSYQIVIDSMEPAGVGARRSDTKSISVVSVSWPTAEITGIGQAATVRARASSLNGQRSSIDPPPRATIRTSGRGMDPPSGRAANPRTALATCLAACSPWTTQGQTST